MRQEIGLSGDVGVLQPLAARLVDPDQKEPESAVGDFETDTPPASEDEAMLPGPTPDPSRIPSVVRKIGEFNLETSMAELGGRKSSEPDMEAICEILDELEEEVEPLNDTLSGDPLTEAWIQLLLTLVVREHGHTSLPQLNRDGSWRKTQPRSSRTGDIPRQTMDDGKAGENLWRGRDRILT